MESKMLGVLAVLLTVASAMPNTYSSSSPHYHSSLGSLRSCQRTSGGYAVSSEPGVYRHEYTSQSVPVSVPASSSSYRVVETRPVEYYTSSHQSRPVIYESSSHSASRPVIYESSQSSRPVIYESSSSSHSRPVIYESSSSSSHNSRPVIYESSAPSTASRTYTTYTQYENPSPVRVSYTPAVSTRNTYYTSGGSNDGYTRYEYPATNVRYTSGSSGSGGCTRCSKKK